MSDLDNYISIKPVSLDDSKCNGCINCMKRCPTEAIRVREGKARIQFDRCVGCGECVRVCPNRAKSAECDKLADIGRFKYKVALPCPSIYGQFNNLTDVNYIIEGLIGLGFDDVFEVGLGTELITRATKELIDSGKQKTVIGTLCPAVTKLVMFRYEELIKYLSPFVTAEEAAAKIALQEAMAKTGLPREDIGIIVISPCSAKTFELKGGTAVDYIDGVISFAEIYSPLVSIMNKVTEPRKLSKVGKLGLSAACSTYVAKNCADVNYLAADGIESIINILSEMENGNFGDAGYIELSACVSGCVGGCLNMINPFAARSSIRRLAKNAAYSRIDLSNEAIEDLKRKVKLKPAGILKLSDDRMEALKKILKINSILEKLPNLDCGGCGAPSCRAFAEDLVNGVKASCRYLSSRRLLDE